MRRALLIINILLGTAAVAVAAHEVSHAVQHARQEPAFMRRFNLVTQLVWVERAAIGVLLLARPLSAALAVPFIFGVILLIEGVGLLYLAFKARRHET